MSPMSEATEQMKVVEWCRVTDWQSGGALGLANIFHIPNGGWRSKSEAAKLKAMGVVAGVPDLFLPLMCGGKGGLWIEMKKSTGGRISGQQSAFGERLQALGYEWRCCNGAEEAIGAIREYVKL